MPKIEESMYSKNLAVHTYSIMDKPSTTDTDHWHPLAPSPEQTTTNKCFPVHLEASTSLESITVVAVGIYSSVFLEVDYSNAISFQ